MTLANLAARAVDGRVTVTPREYIDLLASLHDPEAVIEWVPKQDARPTDANCRIAGIDVYVSHRGGR